MKQGMKMTLKTGQRQELLGRLRMAQWIEMPERDFAREIARLEKDTLFKKLYHGDGAQPGVIRRQRWPRGRFGGLELLEGLAAGRQRVGVEEKLESRDALVDLIRRVGQRDFERYFLYAEEALPLGEIARRTGISEDEAARVNDLLVELGAEAEFAGPAEPAGAPPRATIASVELERSGEPSFAFASPHWARGLYHIRYDLLESLKGSGSLSPEDLRKLPGMLKRLETLNLRQNTMYRIMESLVRLQSDYLRSKDPERKRAVSLRLLARRLDLAPSTVSRALHGRSIVLPWGEQGALIDLLPGRRRQLRLILEDWLAEDPSPADAALVERLKNEHGIAASRRTVNAVRHELKRLRPR